MKKFFIFLVFLLVLIIAEYYFFVELFSQKRFLVLMPSLFLVLACIYGIFRFTKKTIFNTKPS